MPKEVEVHQKGTLVMGRIIVGFLAVACIILEWNKSYSS